MGGIIAVKLFRVYCSKIIPLSRAKLQFNISSGNAFYVHQVKRLYYSFFYFIPNFQNHVAKSKATLNLSYLCKIVIMFVRSASKIVVEVFLKKIWRVVYPYHRCCNNKLASWYSNELGSPYYIRSALILD